MCVVFICTVYGIFSVQSKHLVIRAQNKPRPVHWLVNGYRLQGAQNFFAAASRVIGLCWLHPEFGGFCIFPYKYLTMNTFRQHLQERAHPTSTAVDITDPEDEFDPDEYLRARYGDPDSKFDNLTSTEQPAFDRFNKSAEFDFRKGIVQPEPQEWEPDVRIGQPVEPYDRESEFLSAFDQPRPDNRFTAPTGWRYVGKDEDPARYGTAPADSGLPDLKYDPQSRTLVPAGAPALDLGKKDQFRFNRLTQRQEPVGDEPEDTEEVKQTTWRDIYRLNKKTIGSNPGLIKAGQVLKMPNGAPDYTVQTGDTLSKIADQNSSDAAPVKRPERPITPTPDNKDSQPRRVRTPTPVQQQAASITPTLGNIQPRQTAADGLNFPPNAGFALAPGEELVVPKKFKAERERLAKDTMAQAIRMGAEREAERQKNQAAKKSKNESSELDRILSIARHSR